MACAADIGELAVPPPESRLVRDVGDPIGEALAWSLDVAMG
jgi:hypothetical protein